MYLPFLPIMPSDMHSSSAQLRSTLHPSILAELQPSTTSSSATASGDSLGAEDSFWLVLHMMQEATSSLYSKWCSWKPPATSLSARFANEFPFGPFCYASCSSAAFSIPSRAAGHGVAAGYHNLALR